MVELAHGRIRIEIVPWLSQLFGQRGSSRLILEEEIEREMVLVDLLTSLSRTHPAIGKAIVDLQAGRLFDHVNIVHNDTVLGSQEALKQIVRQGDTLVFLPAYVGG